MAKTKIIVRFTYAEYIGEQLDLFGQSVSMYIVHGKIAKHKFNGFIPEHLLGRLPIPLFIGQCKVFLQFSNK